MVSGVVPNFISSKNKTIKSDKNMTDSDDTMCSGGFSLTNRHTGMTKEKYNKNTKVKMIQTVISVHISWPVERPEMHSWWQSWLLELFSSLWRSVSCYARPRTKGGRGKGKNIRYQHTKK